MARHPASTPADRATHPRSWPELKRWVPVRASEHAQDAADPDGLRAAFLEYGGELLGFARKALYSSDGAEDVVQETFARALRSKNRYDPELGTLRTWLFTIERKVIIDTIARQARARVPLLQEVSEDHVESAMLGWQMEAALLKLAPEHRLVITEIYFNGRTGREVAELFDIPEGTVRSRLFYAIRELRVLFEEGK